MNYTVYIRKQNWLRFEQEEKKAELINKLLSEHYKDDTIVTKPGKQWDLRPPTGSSPSPSKALEELKVSKGVNLCNEHNLPLTVYGKCLQKGCKNG